MHNRQRRVIIQQCTYRRDVAETHRQIERLADAVAATAQLDDRMADLANIYARQVALRVNGSNDRCCRKVI